MSPMIRWIKIKKMNFPIHRPAPAGKNIISHTYAVASCRPAALVKGTAETECSWTSASVVPGTSHDLKEEKWHKSHIWSKMWSLGCVIPHPVCVWRPRGRVHAT